MKCRSFSAPFVMCCLFKKHALQPPAHIHKETQHNYLNIQKPEERNQLLIFSVSPWCANAVRWNHDGLTQSQPLLHIQLLQIDIWQYLLSITCLRGDLDGLRVISPSPIFPFCSSSYPKHIYRRGAGEKDV